MIPLALVLWAQCIRKNGGRKFWFQGRTCIFSKIYFHVHDMPPIELPRLTGSLRAFSGLSSPYSRLPENDDILKRKRQLRSRKQLEKTLSWSELKGLILDATSFDKNASQEVWKKKFVGNGDFYERASAYKGKKINPPPFPWGDFPFESRTGMLVEILK